jgi:hypothetical protein
MELRANTAVDVLVGPILDSVAATEEAGETIAQANVLLSKNGQGLTQKSDVTTCVFDDHGCYNCELDATDMNTVGILTIVIFMAGTMIYRADYSVVCEAYYDAKYKSQGQFIGQIQAVALSNPAAGSMRITLADPGLSQAVDDQLNGSVLEIIDRSTRETLNSRVIYDWDDTNNYAFIDDADFTPTTGMDYRVRFSPPASSAAPTEVDLSAQAKLDVNAECDTAIVDGALATSAELASHDAVLDSLVATVGVDGAGLTDLGGMSTGMKAEANAEVVDALATDTYVEPAQGAPGATVSLADKISFLYKAWRNKIIQDKTTGVMEIYNDAGAVVDHKATHTDDGTDFTKAKIVSGP